MTEERIHLFIVLIGDDQGKIGYLKDRLSLENEINSEFKEVEAMTLEYTPNADVLMALLSRESLQNRDFLEWVEKAKRLKIRILPVIIEKGLNYSSIPESINPIQWVELWEEVTREVRITRMIKAIKTDYAHLEEFRSYERSAEDWFVHAEKPDRLLRGRALEAAETWLIQARSNFPRPTEVVERFFLLSREYAESTRIRNERIMRVFWTFLGFGGAVSLIFAVLIFRDTLLIQEAEREAELRKQQSHELIEYMVGELDEQLTKMGERELLEGIIVKAEAYVLEMKEDTLEEDDRAFKNRLTALIAQARLDLDSLTITPVEQ